MKRALVITSHKNNAKALEHLFESLETCPEINDIDIFAVVGGFDAYATSSRGSFEIIQAPHNSIDYTGLLAILDLGIAYDSYFYIHDTTRAGPTFLRKIIDLPPTTNSASFQFPSMNMGLYSHTCLQHSRQLLDTFRNTDDAATQHFKKRCVEMEDCIFRSQIDRHVFLSNDPPRIEGHPVEYYGGGVQRIIEYYACMDLYKIKANWYVKSTYELDL